MAALHVSEAVADPPLGTLTDGMAGQDKPKDGFEVNATGPEKPCTELTVIVEVPEFVARIDAGETAPVETVKSG